MGGVGGNDVTLRREPTPTAATLAYFHATRMSGCTTVLEWGTMVEVQTLGYRLEQGLGGGDWAPVTAQLIPAQGQDQRPHHYRFEGTSAATGIPSRYRLIEIDWRGQHRVIAEARVELEIRAVIERTTTGWELRVAGSPVSRCVLETTADLAGGFWAPLTTTTLDATGAARLRVEVNEQEAQRFFRVRRNEP